MIMTHQHPTPTPQVTNSTVVNSSSVQNEVLAKLDATKIARDADLRCAEIDRAALCNTVEDARSVAQSCGVSLFQDVLGYSVFLRAVALKNENLALALAELALQKTNGEGLPFLHPEEQDSIPQRTMRMALRKECGSQLMTALARLVPPTRNHLAFAISYKNNSAFRVFFPKFESCWRLDLGDTALTAAVQIMDYPSFITLASHPDVRAGTAFRKEAWRLIVLHGDSEGEKINAWLALHANEPCAKSILQAIESCRPKQPTMDKTWFSNLLKADHINEIALEKAWQTALELGNALVSHDTLSVQALRPRLWQELRAAGSTFSEEAFQDLTDLLQTKVANNF